MVLSPMRVQLVGIAAVLGPLSVIVLGLSFAIAMVAAVAMCIQPRERIDRTILRDAVPVTAPLLGREMSSMVLAIGIAANGYALWSDSRATSALEPATSRS